MPSWWIGCRKGWGRFVWVWIEKWIYHVGYHYYPFIFLSPHTWFANKQMLTNTYVDNKFTESTYTYLKLLSPIASFPALELNFANCMRCVWLVTNFGPTWLIWEAAMLMSDAGSMVEVLDPIPSPLNSPWPSIKKSWFMAVSMGWFCNCDDAVLARKSPMLICIWCRQANSISSYTDSCIKSWAKMTIGLRINRVLRES